MMTKCIEAFVGWWQSQPIKASLTKCSFCICLILLLSSKIYEICMPKKIVQQDDSEKINILGLRERRSGRTRGHELCRSFSQAPPAATSRRHQPPPPAAAASCQQYQQQGQEINQKRSYDCSLMSLRHSSPPPPFNATGRKLLSSTLQLGLSTFIVLAEPRPWLPGCLIAVSPPLLCKTPIRKGIS